MYNIKKLLRSFNKILPKIKHKLHKFKRLFIPVGLVFKRIIKQSVTFIRCILNYIRDNIIPTIISLIVVGIFYVVFHLEISNNRADSFFDKDFWLDEIFPNVIADMIGVVITTFIIAELFSSYQKRKELKLIYSILGTKFEMLIESLARNLVYLIRRDESLFFQSKSDVYDSLLELDRNINKYLVFTEFYNDFTIIDIRFSSPIYDGFFDKIPSIEAYNNQFFMINNKIGELNLKKNELEVIFKLQGFANNQQDKEKTLNELQKVKSELSKYYSLIFNFDKIVEEDLLNVKYRNVLEGFSLFNASKIDEFIDNYNTLIPLDMRKSLLDIKNHVRSFNWSMGEYQSPSSLTKLDVNEYKDLHKNKSIEYIQKLSKGLINLSEYFKRVKNY